MSKHTRHFEQPNSPCHCEQPGGAGPARPDGRSGGQSKILLSGFSLLEMVVYVAILSLIAVIVVNTVLSLGVSFNSLRATRDINSSALVALERMGRDIRSAVDVDTVQSVLDSHPGVLSLDGGVETEFYLDGGVLKVREGGVEAGALTKEAAAVTNLVFHFITDPSSHRGVYIEMELLSTRGTITKTERFSTFITLRAPYN